MDNNSTPERKSSSKINTRGTVWGIARNVFILGLVSFFTDVSTEMVYPLIPLFINIIAAGNAPLYVGIIEGIAESTASILKVFSGWFSDKIKKRKALVLTGYGLSTLGKPFFAIATHPIHVLFVRFADRIGKGIRTAPRDALIAGTAQEHNRGKSYGFHRTLDSAGAALGGIVAVLLLILLGSGEGNFRLLFLIAFIPALIAVLLIIFFVRDVKVKRQSKKFSIVEGFKKTSKGFKLFLLIMIIFTLGNSSNAFLILRASDLANVDKLPLWLPVLLWVVFNITYAVFSIPSGIISDKIGRKKVIIAGFAVYALVYLGFGFAASFIWMWLLFPVYGVFYGLTDGVMRAYVADMTTQEYKASAFGLYHTAIGITALPASVIVGLLWNYVNVQTAFAFGAALAFVAAVLLLRVKREQ